MKHSNLTFLIISIFSLSLQSQSLDTLVDVGGYNLHFTIIEGKGTPILFEAGGGNDGSVWKDILEPIYQVTGTTLITYDRSGFGRSELNPNETDSLKFGIINGMMELETGLKKLGYDGEIILVSHSYGNFYTTMFAERHPDKVKYVVMVDGNHINSFTDSYIDKYMPNPEEVKEVGLGLYYLVLTFPETLKLMRQTDFPASIPVVDLIAGIPFSFMTEDEWELVVKSHAEFVKAQSNRKELTAYGCKHYIFLDNPSLVINTIVKAYAETLDAEDRVEILNRALDKAIVLSIETKKREIEYLHSEEDLNDWGKALAQTGDLEKALEVLKLNVILHPESWKVYDSYGEALMKRNRNDEAKEMYRRSIELNPENENGKKMLDKINQE